MFYGIAFIIGAVVGFVAGWLIFRNNPALNAQAEGLAKQAEKIINK